jgi:hypothetical protein
VIENGEVDPVSKSMADNIIVHTVIRIKVKPVIFKSLLAEKNEFEFHTDISIDKITL